MPVPDPDETEEFQLPVQVEVIINADGSVTFADLETGMISVISKLNPDQPIICKVPERQEPLVSSEPSEGDEQDQSDD